MTPEELERLLSVHSENEHLEFKEAKQQLDSTKLFQYCIALANEGGGKLVLGVTNKRPRQVVGTQTFPNLQSIRQKLFHALRVRVEAEEVDHPAGRILVFHVPSRPMGMPLEYDGRYLMRVGEDLVSMSADQLQRILDEAAPDYSAQPVPAADFSAIDPAALENFRARWIRRSGNTALAALSPEQLMQDAGLWIDDCPNYAGLILLGTATAVARHIAHSEGDSRVPELGRLDRVPAPRRVPWGILWLLRRAVECGQRSE